MILGNSHCISGVGIAQIWRAVTIVVITLASGGKGGGRGLSGTSTKRARSRKEIIAVIVLAKKIGNGECRTSCPSIHNYNSLQSVEICMQY
jgi:hypothetical protein